MEGKEAIDWLKEQDWYIGFKNIGFLHDKMIVTDENKAKEFIHYNVPVGCRIDIEVVDKK